MNSKWTQTDKSSTNIISSLVVQIISESPALIAN